MKEFFFASGENKNKKWGKKKEKCEINYWCRSTRNAFYTNLVSSLVYASINIISSFNQCFQGLVLNFTEHATACVWNWLKRNETIYLLLLMRAPLLRLKQIPIGQQIKIFKHLHENSLRFEYEKLSSVLLILWVGKKFTQSEWFYWSFIMKNVFESIKPLKAAAELPSHKRKLSLILVLWE